MYWATFWAIFSQTHLVTLHALYAFVWLYPINIAYVGTTSVLGVWKCRFLVLMQIHLKDILFPALSLYKDLFSLTKRLAQIFKP
jgi:hypothetical protein